jgi:hypothetical protein
MMELDSGQVGCDFCATTTSMYGRVIYSCDDCGADCCSSCSDNAPDDSYRILCDPGPESGQRGCAPEEL